MNDKAKDRSPRSPSMTLEDAVKFVKRLYQEIRGGAVSSEIGAKAMGYAGINGAALSTLGTLTQYGLISRGNSVLTVTPLAVRILHPTSEEKKLEAIREAAKMPRVFQESIAGFEGASENVIAAHLVQNGFIPDRAQAVASIYTANKTFAKLGETEEIAVPEEKDKPIDSPKTNSDAPLIALKSNTRGAPQVSGQQGLKVLAQYNIPLGANEATLVFTGESLTGDDFEALKDFVDFAKKQFERAQKKVVKGPPAPVTDELESPTQGVLLPPPRDPIL